MKLVRHTTEDGVTEQVIKVAKSRVFPLLEGWRLMDYDIHRLLVSAYLQGSRDMAQTIIRETHANQGT